jgi:hypothetical protein
MLKLIYLLAPLIFGLCLEGVEAKDHWMLRGQGMQSCGGLDSGSRPPSANRGRWQHGRELR